MFYPDHQHLMQPPQPPPVQLFEQYHQEMGNRSNKASRSNAKTTQQVEHHQRPTNDEQWTTRREEGGSLRDLDANLQANSTSASNLLSTQMFKDELMMKQSRLSPTADPGGLSIDDKIRLRREAQMNKGQHHHHHHHQEASTSSHSSMQQTSADSLMPDKLLTSSTLQRDKRPFAYSPDVSDPNNRGKLDLSHIKSPTMRRRLLANMDSSSSGDEEAAAGLDDELDSVPPQQQKHPTAYNQEQNSTTQIASSSCEPPPKAPPRTRSNAPPAKASPSSQINGQQQEPSTSIRYSAEPPTFYDINQGHYMIHESIDNTRPKGSSGQKACSNTQSYLNDLNEEIAESLESLSMLAKNIDQAQQLHQRHANNQRKLHGESQQRQQQQHQRVSTFSPASGPPPYERPRQITNQRAGFYSVLPSGRPAREYPVPGNYETSEYFGSSSNSGPYSITPYYGASLDINEQPQSTNTKTRCNTSHGTFAAFPHRSTNYDENNRDNYNAPHYYHSSQPKTTSSQSVSSSASSNSAPTNHNNSLHIDGHRLASSSGRGHAHGGSSDCYDSGPLNYDQVQALRDMTAKLKREVDRLHGMELSQAQSRR